MNTRLRNMILKAGAFLCIGLIYSYLYVNGLRIPCIYYTVTGLLCPGCGISRMCIALLHLDIKAAFSYNAGVMLALPIMMIVAMQMIVKYLRTGSKNLTKTQDIVVWFLIVYLILFGIMRNIPILSFLQPAEW